MTEAASDVSAEHTDERFVRRPLRPGVDPFYDPPFRLAQLSPGTVIRSRQVRVGFLGLVAQRGLTAWQLAYRSADLHGNAEVAVTTVLVPRDHDPEQAQTLVAYQCAIDAVSDRCFPSYALRPGSRGWGSLPQFELLLIAGLLERGHVVSICDHEGRYGYFAAPREPGYRVLDGIRATRSFAPLGMDVATPVGMIGYSGGGMATSWAAEMAPEHAPEIPIVGAVLGSPVGDPGEAFIKLNAGLHAGLPAMVVSGLQHIYPGIAGIVRRHANLEGRRRLDALQEMSTMEAIVRYAFDDFDDFLDDPLADVIGHPEVLEVFSDLRLGQRIPSCPLLVLQSVHDQIIDVVDVDSQVSRYVDGGAEVTYVRDRLSEHLVMMVVSVPLMFAWLDQRFAGVKPPVTGTRTVTSLALSARAWPGFLRMAGAAAKVVVGRAG